MAEMACSLATKVSLIILFGSLNVLDHQCQENPFLPTSCTI